jgi:hypothetical protein
LKLLTVLLWDRAARSRRRVPPINGYGRVSGHHPIYVICEPGSRKLCDDRSLTSDRGSFDPAFDFRLLCSVVAGGRFGLTIGLIAYAVNSDGQRDFASETSISADRYEVHADDEVAAEVRSALASTPGP